MYMSRIGIAGGFRLLVTGMAARSTWLKPSVRLCLLPYDASINAFRLYGVAGQEHHSHPWT